MIGKTISHYKILEELGRGGMGVVYKARDTKLDRFVALKFLPPHLSQDEENKKRFIHEAKAASALDHPNICTIYEIDETKDGQMFIAMACYQGESLKEKIERRPLPLEEAIDLAIQVARGLAKAHSKEIIHRDIKPANILLTEDEQVKIVDFGLAKLAGRTMLTKEGTTLGTIAYMSPEQTQGAKVDHRTDIWSLGALLYEMVTGQQPFKGDYEQAVIYSIMNEKPEPLTGLRKDVPLELERITNKAMAKNPDERYQHVNELLGDLKSAKKVPMSTDKDKSRASKSRTPLYAALTALLTLLIVAGWYFSRSSDSKTVDSSTTTVQRLAVLPFTNVRNDPEIDFLGFALADQIIGGLTYVKNILVRPSSAVRQYQNQLIDAPTAGENLKVDFVLMGNYLKEAEVVRLNVELVNVHNNELIWREPIEVQYQSAFKLQDMVAEKVTNGLEVQFSLDERNRIQADIPQNPLAYEYYLRSKSFPNTIEGYKLAKEMLIKSIQLDSTYAPAFDELGYHTYRLASFEFGGDEEIENAKRAYEKALSLNPELLNALSKLALLFTETGKIDESVKLLRRALQINPNSSYTHFSLSHAYRYAGMLNESQKEAEKALELDPKNPRFRSTAVTYIYLGKYNQAFEACNLDKGSTWSTAWQGVIFFRQGQRKRAIEYFDRVIAMEPEGLFAFWTTAIKAFAEGNNAVGISAMRRFEQALQFDGEAWYHMANNYALLGDKAGCLRTLQKAIEGGFFNYPFMLTDPFLDSVRDDLEFQRVLAMAKEKHEQFKKRFFSSKD